ncbi:MAG: hypothetical protein SVZ03_14060 [Spirochaetota bacterium]|nr:hypothetical protein [Spirochaetota bacterium]
MLSDKENEKIERRAKALLASKDIPSDKMEIVRSLIKNTTIPSGERYSAIVDLIKSCDDKSKSSKGSDRMDTKSPRGEYRQDTASSDVNKSDPLDTNQFIKDIYWRYKKLKIFRKRYLIRTNNRLGIGIKRRLIPNRRLLKIIRWIISYQEMILSRLPAILMEILKDKSIEDATHFNYLRIFRRWMMETPIVKYSFDELKWMDRRSFELELKSYIVHFFSFLTIDIETKEQIILLVENKLRLSDDLLKEKIDQTDSESLKREKEKRNLDKEKKIYEYMMILRSFLPTRIDSESVLSNQLRLRYGISSLSELLIILIEALIFLKDVEIKDITDYFNITAPQINGEVWDYSIDFLKTVGKDEESRKERHIGKLKEELIPYNELHSLIKLKIEGQNILYRAFEDQWKIDNRKQKDYSVVYERDFLTFLDECINFFNNSFVPFFNGSIITFEDKDQNHHEGMIFNAQYFSNEMKRLSELLGEMHLFRSNNPRMAVGREEVLKILKGKIPSMAQVERLILLIGDLFFNIGAELQRLYDIHRRWKEKGSEISNTDLIRTPMDVKVAEREGVEGDRPIPFSDCRVIGLKDMRLLSDQLIGKSVLSNSLKGGIIIHIIAFSYQLANECIDEGILSRLDERREILRKIKEINI